MRRRHKSRILFRGGFVAAVLCFCISAGANPLVGFIEGQLKIISSKEVELSGTGPSKPQGGNYADYSLVVVNRTTGQQVARITPDRTGAFRLAVPAGDYMLDVDRSRGGNCRANPQR